MRSETRARGGPRRVTYGLAQPTQRRSARSFALLTVLHALCLWAPNETDALAIASKGTSTYTRLCYLQHLLVKIMCVHNFNGHPCFGKMGTVALTTFSTYFQNMGARYFNGHPLIIGLPSIFLFFIRKRFYSVGFIVRKAVLWRWNIFPKWTIPSLNPISVSAILNSSCAGRWKRVRSKNNPPKSIRQ